MDRRAFVATGLLITFAGTLPALALTERAARRLVTKVVDDINTIINSGKSEAGMIDDFETLFANYADVETIARYTLGVDARSMSAGELARFTQVFRGYMARKYGKRFREFIGGGVEVRDARKVKSFVEVRTVAWLDGASPFEVAFMVSDRSGEERFFNMYIEGVNLLLSERTEIQAMLDRRRGDMDRLIADLAKAG